MTSLSDQVEWELIVLGLDFSMSFRFPLKAPAPSWFQVSPAVELLHPLLIPVDEKTSIDLCIGSEVWASRTFLVARVKVADENAIERLRSDLWPFFRRLRYHSRQATLPPKVAWYTGMKEEEVLEPVAVQQRLEALRSVRVQMNRRYLDTAVRLEHLSAALRQDDVPISADILLDAVAAFWGEDYRRAILYAAIAAEACASEALGQALQDVLQNQATEHRVYSQQQAGGAVRIVDGVAEYLMNGDSFKAMLHARTLYLLGRSMMFDEENTYREAIELYEARNKIAHGRSLETTRFALTEDDAERAIRCAQKVFKWFGVHDRYLPEDGFTK